MKVSIYVWVFGAVIVLILLAYLSTFVFNQAAPSANAFQTQLSSKNYSLSSLKNYGPAPAIQGIANWINSPALDLSQLKGKVVLVDFWTYSCINCIRTIPYLNAWESKYANNGLVIIGVSTPEFQFEHNYSNVLGAVKQFGIKYPVALDNNYSTWTAYDNHYWPADYLIDKNGDVRYITFGEGDYNTTEAVIQLLLENASYNVSGIGIANLSENYNLSEIESPELYLGYKTNRTPIGNAQGFSPDNVVNYTFTNLTQDNTAYFSGEWQNDPDSMVAVNNSKLFLVYDAKNVNVVASGTNSIVSVEIDGKNLSGNYLGSDTHLSNGTATANISSSRLYNIVSAPTYAPHVLEIDAKPGFRIYTFTFG